MRRRELLKAGAAAPAMALAACGQSDAPSNEKRLADLDAIATATGIRNRDFTAAEAIEAAGRRIEALNGRLGAFFHVDIDRALDRVKAAGEAGPLFGVPFALKDLNNYPGAPFTRGSALFKEAVGDAVTPYTEKLEAAGLVVLGKTATPEFGLLPTTEPLVLPICRNPWNLDHSAGGSSGGSAAAVAARLIPAAQASDGGGSIRIPASCCGVFGMKPTRGRFPEQGNPRRLVDLSIKHAVSRSVRDNALLLAVSEADDGPLPPVGFIEPADLAPLRIAVSLKNSAGLDPDPAVAGAVMTAAALLETMGHEISVVEETPAHIPGASDAFNLLWAHGAHGIYQLAEQLTGAPPEETGALEPFTIGLAKAFVAEDGEAQLEDAVAMLEFVTQQTLAWFETYDAWLSPVTAAPPPAHGVLKGDVPFETLVGRLNQYVGYTPVHNAAGTPAVSAPFSWTDDDLPIGVQIAADVGGEALLLRLAYAIEEARPWAGRRPAILSEI